MKEKFEKIFIDKIKRNGSSNLLKWLNDSDFFIAPASTKFHGCCEGGLLKHSLNVYERLSKIIEKTEIPFTVSDETIAIISLLHDLCKVNFYTQEMRNVKENGKWIQKPFYIVNDQLCYGHGEGSVYIISSFIKLTREEALAINWHMGGFDNRVKGGSYALTNAWEKYPLGCLLHCADLQATYLDETIKEK